MKNNGVIIIAIIVIVVILSVILIGLTHSTPEPVIQGEVEISDYRLSSKVPSRVMKIKVQEGDFVKKGDTVAIMEAPEVAAKLSQAEAAKRAAQALQNKAQAGVRSEQIEAAYEMWQKAKAGLDVYEKTYQRVEKLFNEIAPKYEGRNGGYTRILKMGPRRGDACEMAVLELI